MGIVDVLDREGAVPAGRLAQVTGLSTGAMTTALDRLERSGYARRVRDAGDRRRVLVQLTEQAGTLRGTTRARRLRRAPLPALQPRAAPVAAGHVPREPGVQRAPSRRGGGGHAPAERRLGSRRRRSRGARPNHAAVERQIQPSGGGRDLPARRGQVPGPREPLTDDVGIMTGREHGLQRHRPLPGDAHAVRPGNSGDREAAGGPGTRGTRPGVLVARLLAGAGRRPVLLGQRRPPDIVRSGAVQRADDAAGEARLLGRVPGGTRR